MDENYRIIDEYNALLYGIYLKQGIRCLMDDHYSYNGKSVLGMCNDAIVLSVQCGLHTKLNQVCDELEIPRSDKNFVYNENELCNITGDIKYRLGTLFLYHPYIVRLSDSWGYHKGKKHYVYNQTKEDARFNREIPVAFENIYKFWQRLSDYLSCFFPEVITKLSGKTYFHHSFDHILKYYSQLTKSDNFAWLSNFAYKEYSEFNKKRNFFVHLRGYDNEFFQKFLNQAKDDPQAIADLDAGRDEMLVYLKDQLDKCMIGYVSIMEFLNELDITPTDNEAFIYALKIQPAQIIAI